jgi:phage terminase large subunit
MIGRDPFDAWLDEREAELLAEKGEAPKGYSLPNGWSPRPYQEPVWRFLNNGGKRACLIWHRRAGKDSLALNWTAVAADRRPGDYWHMLPEQSQARKAIWDATSPHTGGRLIDQAFPLEMRESTRDLDMLIRFRNGGTWRLVGSDNYNSLVGSTPAGIVFSEWALADPKAEAFLRPMLAESKGWAIYITTPRGTNHARQTYDLAKRDPGRWFAQVLTVDDTGIFSPEEIETELREYQKLYGTDDGNALFAQEYHCSWEGAFVGSYYGAHLLKMLREKRIGNVQPEPGAPVCTAWDLGISDSTAIWFIQRVGREYRLVDYHEGSGVGLDEYARIVQQKAHERRWVYDRHYFPHDVAHRELSNQGRSRVDTLRQLGIKPTVVPVSNVNDGINAVRQILDMAWIDESYCERGLNALRAYRREWSEKLQRFDDRPRHDAASHAADALRTFACGFRDYRDGVMSSRLSGYDRPPIINVGRGWSGRGGDDRSNPGTGWMRH